MNAKLCRQAGLRTVSSVLSHDNLVTVPTSGVLNDIADANYGISCAYLISILCRTAVDTHKLLIRVTMKIGIISELPHEEEQPYFSRARITTPADYRC